MQSERKGLVQQASAQSSLHLGFYQADYWYVRNAGQTTQEEGKIPETTTYAVLIFIVME